MDDKLIYLYCVLCIIDFIVIIDMRRFLFDFLIGCKNRKSAQHLHMQQSFKDKLSLSYILPVLKHNARVFKRYQKLYMTVVYTLLPQYVILLACNSMMGMKSICILAVFALLKLVIAFIIRIQTDSNLVSRYRKK